MGKIVEESMYRLRGVVHHVGSTAYSGHYTTCAKSSIRGENEEQWVFFDDRVGAKKSMNYVTGYERNQRNCYMALYELGEAKTTVEAEDFTLGKVSNRSTLLCPPGDSNDDPPVIGEAAASDGTRL